MNRSLWGLTLLVAASACLQRSRPVSPTAGVTPTPGAAISDTAARRMLREQEERALQDSIRAALQAPPLPEPPKAAAPAESRAERPQERCILDVEGRENSRAYSVRDPTSGKYTSYLGGGAIGRCRSQDITVEADSVESYDQNALYILIGNVRYRDPRVQLDADRVTYFRSEERLLLEGDVHAVMTRNDAALDGPRVEYLRPVRGVRSESRVIATGRPSLTLTERDSVGRPLPPAVLHADIIVAEGDSIFAASGRVELQRSDLYARGDSAYLHSGRRLARLLGSPYLESKGTQTLALRGRVVDIYGNNRSADRIIAMDSAEARGRDLTVHADTIDLRLSENRLQRAFAFGRGGASVTTMQHDVSADSLDILIPDQQLRELRAVGKALARSRPDTNVVKTREADWIKGDTVVAQFDPPASAQASGQPQLRQLVAVGAASAFYQIPVKGGDPERPGINYVRGRVIRLSFSGNEVANVVVQDSVAGLYLEPTSDTTRSQRRPPQSARPPLRRP